MKKSLKFLIGVLVILPISVKADMGAPGIRTYKATPKSTDGATIYEKIYSDNPTKEGKFDYNEILTVSIEEKSNGKVYAYACNKSDKCGNVLISDLKLSKAADDLEGYDLKYQGRVFSQKAIDVYEGPGYIYEKTGDKIPTDAEVIVSGYEENEGTWLKVKYKDIEGYVDSDDAAVMILYKGEALVESTNKVVKEFYLSNAWNSKMAYKENGQYVVTNYYREFSGEFRYSKTEFKAVKDIKVAKRYTSDYEDDSNIIGTIKKGDNVKIIYDASYQGSVDLYVESNSLKGWISFIYDEGEKYLDGFDYEKISLSIEYKELNKPVEAKDVKNPKGDVVTPDKKEDKKNNKKSKFFENWTKNQIIIVSAIAGAAIVLTAIITIIFMNKKSKNKIAKGNIDE